MSRIQNRQLLSCVFLLNLTGCLFEMAPSNHETSQAGQPLLETSLILSVDHLSTNRWTDIALTGLEPSEEGQLYRGRSLGDGSCPAELGGQCLALNEPAALLDTVQVDDDGIAWFSIFVPDGPSSREICFQAAVIRGVDGEDSQLSEPICANLSRTERCVSTPHHADWFVEISGDNSATGNSPLTPVENIAVALGRAISGDIIEVGPGVHTMLSSLIIPGGVRLVSREGPTQTIIDGASAGCIDLFGCPRALVEMGDYSALIGFTLHNAPGSYGIYVDHKTDALIAGNIIDPDAHSGIRLNTSEIEIVHNTIVNNSWGGITKEGVAGNNVVRNNIIAFHPESSMDNDNWDDNWDIDFNLLFNPGAEYGEIRADNGVGPNNLEGVDPLFVDADGGDYSLTVDSPGIDAGDRRLGLDGDCDGPDIGALVF